MLQKDAQEPNNRKIQRLENCIGQAIFGLACWSFFCSYKTSFPGRCHCARCTFTSANGERFADSLFTLIEVLLSMNISSKCWRCPPMGWHFSGAAREDHMKTKGPLFRCYEHAAATPEAFRHPHHQSGPAFCERLKELATKIISDHLFKRDAFDLQVITVGLNCWFPFRELDAIVESSTRFDDFCELMYRRVWQAELFRALLKAANFDSTKVSESVQEWRKRVKGEEERKEGLDMWEDEWGLSDDGEITD
jgi:hypothetical protein